jgi:hypothetical protein
VRDLSNRLGFMDTVTSAAFSSPSRTRRMPRSAAGSIQNRVTLAHQGASHLLGVRAVAQQRQQDGRGDGAVGSQRCDQLLQRLHELHAEQALPVALLPQRGQHLQDGAGERPNL